MTGSGTENDPYIISDVDDLQAMNDDRDAYYELGANIDASTTSTWNANAGFIPIGDNTTKFTGYLNGRGYSITDLTIVRATTNYVGLIGYLNTASGVAVKDVTISGTIEGQNYVGGLVGYHSSSATIQDCVSSVNVTGDNHDIGGLVGYNTGGIISNSYCSGTVTATASAGGAAIGGFIGRVDTDITRCYASGAVATAGTEDDVGGFVGVVNSGKIVSNCYSRGVVDGDDDVGGFAGQNDGTIDDCYSTGAATGNTSIGGFCGNNGATITNCFWDTESSSNATSDGGTGKTTAQMKTLATFTGAGWDFTTIWGLGATRNSGYPYLQRTLVGELSGQIAIIQTRFHYLDAFGTERWVEGTAL